MVEILRIRKLDWHDGREEGRRRGGIILCNGLIDLNSLRWRVQCDDNSNGPRAKARLVLEAIVLKEGSGFAGLPLETKKVLSSAS